MTVHTVSLDHEADSCSDDGWEAIEEERLQRRTSRRRIRSSAACDPDGAAQRRDRANATRMRFGGFGYGGLGAGLLAIILLVAAAAYLGDGGYQPFAPVTERPAMRVDHDRFADHDQAYGYAYADYTRRYDTGTAWSDPRPDRETSAWFGERRAWMGGGLLLVLIVLAAAVVLSRTVFTGPADD